jgi:transcription antitermination factor NusG
MGTDEQELGDERFTNAWFALYTKHQHEKKASDVLAKKGFEVFLPVYRSIRRWKDRTKVVSLPVFPCYLFIHTGLDRKFEILKTPGVFSVVESGGKGCAIPGADIDAVRRITEGPARFAPHVYLKKGDRVRVKSGPFSGIEGILLRSKSDFRVVLNVDVLRKAIAVEVDAAAVERIQAAT